jgi:hypothetical protein
MMLASARSSARDSAFESLESRVLLSTPVVSIRAATATTTEGFGPGKPAAILIERAGRDLSQPLSVSFTLGGNASEGDYASLATTAVIPAKAKSVRVPIVAVDDAFAEDSERVVVSLAASDLYAVNASRQAATITIVDNEPIISIVKGKDASEGKTTATAGTFTVKRSGKNLASPFVVELGLQANSTAVEGVDFLDLPSSVTIPAGKPSVVFSVTPIQDSREEGIELISLGVIGSESYRVDAKAGAATIKLTNVTRVSISAALGVTGSSSRVYNVQGQSVVDGEQETFSGQATISTDREGNRGSLSVDYVSEDDVSWDWFLEDVGIEDRADGTYLAVPETDTDGWIFSDWNIEELRIAPGGLNGKVSTKTNFSASSEDGSSISGSLVAEVGLGGFQRITTPAGTFDTRVLNITFKAQASGIAVDEEDDSRYSYSLNLTFAMSFFYVDDLGIIRGTQSLDSTFRAGRDSSRATLTSSFDLVS